MRRQGPGMTRPKRIAVTRPASPSEHDALAARASYLGSREHKAKRSWLGLPGAGARAKWLKTTVCQLTDPQDRSRATAWIQGAIRARQYKFVSGDKDFPKHVWFEHNGRIWYGRCTNPVSGEYKGWPISEEERREIFA